MISIETTLAGEHIVKLRISPGHKPPPLAEIEHHYIRMMIDYHEGNYTLAAKRLGIGRSTLYRRFKIPDVPKALARGSL